MFSSFHFISLTNFRTMVKNIVCHAVYQLAILFVLLYKGRSITSNTVIIPSSLQDLKSSISLLVCMLNSSLRPLNTSLSSSTCKITFILLFQSSFSTWLIFDLFRFVMMTLFNEINARKVHGERNVFKVSFSLNYLWNATEPAILFTIYSRV